MPWLFLLVLLYWIFPYTVFSQWPLFPVLDAVYTCRVTSQDYFKPPGTPAGQDLLRDTLAFDVRRTYDTTQAGWELRHTVTKTYPWGGLRGKQPARIPAFRIDARGRSLDTGEAGLRAPGTDTDDNRPADFLLFTALPLPVDSLNAGFAWSDTLNHRLTAPGRTAALAQAIQFTVQRRERKLGRDCYVIGVRSEGASGGICRLSLSGTLLLDARNGQMLQLELSGSYRVTLQGDPPISAYSLLKMKHPGWINRTLTTWDGSTFFREFQMRLALHVSEDDQDDPMRRWEAAEAGLARLRAAYTWTIPPEYNNLEKITWGDDYGYIAWQNGATGYFNASGRLILTVDFRHIAHVGQGFLRATRDGLYWSLYNSLGQAIIDSLLRVETINDRYFLVQRQGAYQIIDSAGLLLRQIPLDSLEQIEPLERGIFYLKKSGKEGLLRGGKELLPARFHDVRVVFDESENRLFLGASLDSLGFLFDATGRELTRYFGSTPQYKVGRYVGVKRLGFFKSDIFDLGTNTWADLRCGSVWPIGPGLFACSGVGLDYQKTRLFDHDGKEIGAFESLRHNMLDNRWLDSLLIVKKNGRHGILDSRGEWVVPPRYDNIRCVIDSCLLAESHTQGRASLGLLHIEGDTILPFEFTWIQPLQSPWFFVGDKGLFNVKTRVWKMPPPDFLLGFVRSNGDDAALHIATRDGGQGLCNEDFQILLKPEFHRIFDTQGRQARVKVYEKMGVVGY